MTVIEYAESIQKSRFTVYRYIKEGKLPGGVTVKKICGRTLINVGGENKRDVKG